MDLALKYSELFPHIVYGVDLSGDPTCKQFNDFRAMLTRARDNGLRLALHCGEVDNDDEVEEMLTFGMDRMGHGIYVKGNIGYPHLVHHTILYNFFYGNF